MANQAGGARRLRRFITQKSAGQSFHLAGPDIEAA
jgi:hypothetical protein